MNVFCKSMAALAVAFVFSTSANALVIDQIQIVRPDAGNADNSWHLAEVQAFEAGTGINRAESSQGGTASAAFAFGAPPERAIDGNTNGAFGGGSVWHSADPVVNPDIFTVDLAGAFNIENIVLTGRSDCCTGRDDNLEVVTFLNGVEVSRQFAGIIQGNTANIALPVPEPATFALLGLAGAGLMKRRRRMA